MSLQATLTALRFKKSYLSLQVGYDVSVILLIFPPSSCLISLPFLSVVG